MPTKPVLLALFAFLCSAVASPVINGEIENDCDEKEVNDPCMIFALDSFNLGLDGVCKNVAVR
jgi:hypothetical protein